MKNTSLSSNIKSARLISSIIAAVSIGLIFNDLTIAVPPVYQSSLWNDWVFFGIEVALLLCAIAAYWFTRRGQVSTAGWLLSMGIAVTGVAGSVLFKGFEILSLVASLLVVVLISLELIPVRDRLKTIGMGIVGSIIIVLVGMFDYSWRATVPEPILVNGIGAILAIVFTAYIIWQFNSYSLQTKLVLSLISVAVITTAVVAAVLGWISTTALENSTNRTLLSAASQTATNVDTFLHNNLDTVRVESHHPIISSYLSLPIAERQGSELEQQVIDTLSAMADRDPDITSYSIANANGDVLIDTSTTAISKNISDQDYYQKTASGDGSPYVSSVRYSGIDDAPGIYFSSPIYDKANNFLGVLFFRFRASILQQLVSSSNGLAGTESFAVLLDENNIRLADGVNSSTLYKSVTPLPKEVTASLQQAGRLISGPYEETSTNLPQFETGLTNLQTSNIFSTPLESLGGETAVLASVKLQLQPWILVFALPETVYAGPQQSQTRSAIVVALVASLVVAVVGTLLSQLLTRPIIELTHTAERVAAGDLTARAEIQTTDEIGTLAKTFNMMTTQLQSTLTGLEQRITERTQAIEASAEVSRRLSTILDQSQLVYAVVDELQRAFGYYHAHIYLLDYATQTLRLAGGTGEVGQILLAQHHSIPVGRGLVGRAAANGEIVLVANTTEDPSWLPNPLLPDTQSEASVPIKIGGRVLGVLDVQQNTPNAITLDQANLLASIASQVGVAIQNARSFNAAQEEAAREAMINTINQKILATDSVETLLQTAVRELSLIMNAENSTIYLHRSRQQGDKHE